MKSLFLAALAAFALFSGASARAQQYHDSYYRDSPGGAAHVAEALIEIAAHNSHDRRSNYYGGHGYVRDRDDDRYNYAPRYRSYRHQNRHYNSYPSYRQRHHYQSHNGHHRHRHGCRH